MIFLKILLILAALLPWTIEYSAESTTTFMSTQISQIQYQEDTVPEVFSFELIKNFPTKIFWSADTLYVHPYMSKFLPQPHKIIQWNTSFGFVEPIIISVQELRPELVWKNIKLHSNKEYRYKIHTPLLLTSYAAKKERDL